jgi:predicted DNA-binding transcriptional regulator AlpA
MFTALIQKDDRSLVELSNGEVSSRPTAESNGKPPAKFGVLSVSGYAHRPENVADHFQSAESMPSLLAGEYATPEQLAAELGISVRTLHRWHTARQGPPRVVLGRVIFYRRSSVLAWIEGREENLARRGRK